MSDEASDIYKRIVSEVADGIIGVDASGSIRLCNPAAEQMFGWTPGQLLGQPLDVLLTDQARVHHSHHLSAFARGDVDARYMSQRSSGIKGRKADGSEISLWITILRTRSETGGVMMVAVLRDVTEALGHQRALERLADLDPLTGLLNRRSFLAAAEQVLERCSGFNEPLSVVMFDLDHFKRINDTYGHPAGDGVLETFGTILSKHCRRYDLAARWGGEEFILVLARTNLQLGSAVADRVRGALAEIVFQSEQPAETETFRATVSAGIASATAPSDTLKELVSRADTALYEAKRLGRNRLAMEATPVRRDAALVQNETRPHRRRSGRPT
ncbi:MAG: diguanylate cyclase [Rhizobium sp.]|nr:diguanylate cyclase [Rhizobium sp.]